METGKVGSELVTMAGVVSSSSGSSWGAADFENEFRSLQRGHVCDADQHRRNASASAVSVGGNGILSMKATARRKRNAKGTKSKGVAKTCNTKKKNKTQFGLGIDKGFATDAEIKGDAGAGSRGQDGRHRHGEIDRRCNRHGDGVRRCRDSKTNQKPMFPQS